MEWYGRQNDQDSCDVEGHLALNVFWALTSERPLTLDPIMDKHASQPKTIALQSRQHPHVPHVHSPRMLIGPCRTATFSENAPPLRFHFTPQLCLVTCPAPHGKECQD